MTIPYLVTECLIRINGHAGSSASRWCLRSPRGGLHRRVHGRQDCLPGM